MRSSSADADPYNVDILTKDMAIELTQQGRRLQDTNIKVWIASRLDFFKYETDNEDALEDEELLEETPARTAINFLAADPVMVAYVGYNEDGFLARKLPWRALSSQGITLENVPYFST